MKRRTNVQRGWKVVRGGGKRPFISGITTMAERRTVVYLRNRWIGPKRGMGPLCVFARRYEARSFRFEQMRTKKIVPCLYVPSAHKRIWDNFSSRPLNELPSGTMLASEVKIIVPVRKRRNTR